MLPPPLPSLLTFHSRPYLGLSLMDLYFLREGNRAVLERGQPNMVRARKMGKVVWELVLAQRALRLVPRLAWSSNHEDIMALWLGTPNVHHMVIYDESLARPRARRRDD